jgi:hypothetical protein
VNPMDKLPKKSATIVRASRRAGIFIAIPPVRRYFKASHRCQFLIL